MNPTASIAGAQQVRKQQNFGQRRAPSASHMSAMKRDVARCSAVPAGPPACDGDVRAGAFCVTAPVAQISMPVKPWDMFNTQESDEAIDKEAGNEQCKSKV
jgi:hypothetical protein